MEIEMRECRDCHEVKPLARDFRKCGFNGRREQQYYFECGDCMRRAERRRPRLCVQCLETKPRRDFYTADIIRFALAGVCKTCSNTATTSVCTMCGKNKSLSEFSPKPDRRRGVHAHCKPCRAAKQRTRYARRIALNLPEPPCPCSREAGCRANASALCAA